MGDMEELKKRLEKEQREIRIRNFTKNKASVFGLVVDSVGSAGSPDLQV